MLIASFFPHACYPHTILKLLELYTMLLAFLSSSSCLMCCNNSFYILHAWQFVHFAFYLFTLCSAHLTSCLLYALHIESAFHLQWTQLHNTKVQHVSWPNTFNCNDFLKFKCSCQWIFKIFKTICIRVSTRTRVNATRRQGQGSREKESCETQFLWKWIVVKILWTFSKS